MFFYCGLVRNSSAEKALEALVDTRLDTRQQCVLEEGQLMVSWAALAVLPAAQE